MERSLPLPAGKREKIGEAVSKKKRLSTHFSTSLLHPHPSWDGVLSRICISLGIVGNRRRCQLVADRQPSPLDQTRGCQERYQTVVRYCQLMSYKFLTTVELQ